jgi:hypothetical protein
MAHVRNSPDDEQRWQAIASATHQLECSQCDRALYSLKQATQALPQR